MKVLRSDRYPTVPWRNGGGTTREIAWHPDRTGQEDFLWRLSIATVQRPGPFSRFDGVDRTIALLSGAGMLLRSPVEVISVTDQTPPYEFSGETPIACELLDGATIDLNAMSRRNAFRHSLRREKFVGRVTVDATADLTFIVTNSCVELSWLGRVPLHPLDTIAEVEPGFTLELHAKLPAEIFVIELLANTVN